MFRYKAMDAHGSVARGQIEAANLADLETRLTRLGLDLIDGSPWRRLFGFGRLPRRTLIDFCFHLEQLCSAGVPLVDGLADLRDGTVDPRFRAVLAALVESVAGGQRLSEAMAAQPLAFDPVTVSLVRAGEDSGKLPEIFARRVASLKWQDELAAQMRRLTFYPAVLGGVAGALIVFMMTYLVPRMTGLMQSMGRELPLHTEILIAVSRFVGNAWPALIGLPAVAATATTLAVRRSPHARLAWDRAKLRLPIAGNILRKAALARFVDVFALMYGAGIPVLDTLRATASVVGNAAVAGALDEAHRLVAEGAGIAGAFERAGLFPPLVLRMVRVGETTGALDRALLNAGYFFDRDVRDAAERLQAAIEPAVIVTVGAVMAWIMLSVLGPVYDLVAGMRV